MYETGDAGLICAMWAWRREQDISFGAKVGTGREMPDCETDRFSGMLCVCPV